MSGSKVNDYSIGDENIQSVMLTLDKAYKGLHQVSLTNYDNTSESQVAAGSIIENNGGLYKFDSNESISGSPADGTVYIRVVSSGDNATLEYTNTAPTWSDSKQGWYGTGAEVNKRYLEFVITRDSAVWMKRSFAKKRDEEIIKDRSYSRSFRDSAQSFTGSTNFTILFNKKLFDTNSEHDTTTGIFTAKRTGLYSISYRFTLNIFSLGTRAFVQSLISVNGDTVYRGHVAYSTGMHVFSGNTVYNVARGENIGIWVNQSSGASSQLDDTYPKSCLFEVVEL